MQILRNCWYMAGWSEHVGHDKPLARKIANEPIMFYRGEDGTVAALADYCPHRFAPLSLGKLVGDNIQCPYHGLQFNRQGKCVRNPHEAGNLPNASVPSFPVVERYGAIWLWIGDADAADPELINKEYEFLDDPSRAKVSGYIHAQANYLLLLDNLMDISHALFLHGPALMTEELYAKYDPKIASVGEEIVVTLEMQDIRAPGLFQQGLPEGTTSVDFYDYVKYIAPSSVSHDIAYTLPGEPPYQETGASSRAAHFFIPETESTCHYFYSHSRTFLTDSEAAQEGVRAALLKAFGDEDIPMIEAQQRVLGNRELFDLKPAILVNDRASVLVRRTIAKRLREQEREMENA